MKRRSYGAMTVLGKVYRVIGLLPFAVAFMVYVGWTQHAGEVSSVVVIMLIAASVISGISLFAASEMLRWLVDVVGLLEDINSKLDLSNCRRR